jgi:cyclopropane-fatty-acyl-phospholipid synthase
MARLLPTPTAARAAAILREVFSGVQGPVLFRLWDGTNVPLSRDQALCTVAIKSPEAFLHLISNPSPYHFAEAYVQGRIDLEGDLFSVMPVANQLEEMRLPLLQRIRLLVSLWKR